MTNDRVVAIRERMRAILRSAGEQQLEQPIHHDSGPPISELSAEHANKKQWILEEWRRLSIPEWRRILKESIGTGNISREKYARWMLSEILKDDEYIKETD
jgi:hypothetical protein